MSEKIPLERIFTFYDDNWTHTENGDEIIFRHTLVNERYENGVLTADKAYVFHGRPPRFRSIKIVDPIFYYISEEVQARALAILKKRFCRESNK